jgi:FG-GAP-like repeat/FG-GAP repeat
MKKASLAVAVALLVAVGIPSAASGQAVSFSGPTDFSAGSDIGTDVYDIGVADFNRDGDVDLAVPTFGPNVSVLLGGPGGSFGAPITVPVDEGFRTSSLAVGDFNADGDPDLAVTSLSSSEDLPRNVAVLFGQTGAAFSTPTTLAAGDFPIDVAVGDFNRDGDPDLAVANDTSLSSGGISIFVGGPSGGFAGPTSLSGGGLNSVVVGDFNADGDQDLAATLDLAVSVFLGDAGATFGTPTTTPVLSVEEGFLTPASAVGDFNGDGDPDLVVVNSGGGLLVLTGGSAESFSVATELAVSGHPESVAVADFDRDGDPDLAATESGGSRAAIFVGGAASSFSGPTSVPLGDFPRPIAVGDFDADGDADIAAANVVSDDVSILLNTTRAVPTSKAQCKNGGWQTFGIFKNQGDCVSFVATKGGNPPAGH